MTGATGDCGCKGEGCSPGFWKNHVEDWPPTGYDPNQLVSSVFVVPAAFADLGAATLLQALSFMGGPGAHGAAEILLRAAVASLLNSASALIAFPRTTAEVIASVNAALATEDRDAMLTLATALDIDNNLGCPLEGDLLAGGHLMVENGALMVENAIGIDKLETGTVGGVPAWKLTFAPSALRPDAPFCVAWGWDVQDVAIPFFLPRSRTVQTAPVVVVEVYLVNAAGTPIDPLATLGAGVGDNCVHLCMMKAGKSVLTP